MKCTEYKSCPIYLALMSHLEDEMRRWQYKIKHIDDPPDNWDRRDRFDYYNEKLNEITDKVIRINDFMKGSKDE